MKKTASVTGALTALMGVLLAVGVKTFLHPCLHEDGTTGVCGGAANSLFVFGIGIAFVAILVVVVRRGVLRALLSAACFALGVVAALIPGVIKPLCMMETMRCQTVMKPGAVVISVLICVLSLVGIVVSAIGAAKGKRA